MLKPPNKAKPTRAAIPSPSWVQPVFLVMGLSLGLISVSVAQPKSGGFDGDVGLALVQSQHAHAHAQQGGQVLPYLYGDWGSAFVRLDTVGWKLAPLGLGHIEVVGRLGQRGVSFEGPWSGLAERRDGMSLGLGSYQSTPWGGVFVHAFRGLQNHKGWTLDAQYVLKFEALGATLYPQVGLEIQDHRTNRHFYGVGSQDQAIVPGLRSHDVATALIPKAGILMDWPLPSLGPRWHLMGLARVRHLSADIAGSPLVERRTIVNGLVALTHRF